MESLVQGTIFRDYETLNKTYNKYNNNIDQYSKLINKNDTVYDDFLTDYVHEFNKFDLQNCNFVENTVPKLYENKLLTNSKNYSTRKLNYLSPSAEIPRTDNDNKTIDNYRESDIYYDLEKMKYRNMDTVHLQYMAKRGPDNTDTGLFESALPVDIRTEDLSSTRKLRLRNNISSFKNEFADRVTDIYKTSNSDLSNNITKYESDIVFTQPLESNYVYTNAEPVKVTKILPRRGESMTNGREFAGRQHSYRQRQSQNNRNQSTSDAKDDRREFENVSRRTSVENTKVRYVDDDSNETAYDIMHNELNNGDYGGNRVGVAHPQTFTRNTEGTDFIFGKMDEKSIDVRKNATGSKLHNTQSMLSSSESGYKNNRNNAESGAYKQHNRLSTYDDNSDIFMLKKSEYDGVVKDRKDYVMHNKSNKQSNSANKKYHNTDSKRFNYGDYINGNEYKSNQIYIADTNNATKKSVSEIQYEDSKDVADNIDMYKYNRLADRYKDSKKTRHT